MNERRFSPTQAQRLDAPERRTWLPPEEILEKLDLRIGQVVADIGAGTGYFSLPLAAAVGATGKICAVDVEPQMLALLQGKITSASILNIESRIAPAEDCRLENHSCDLVFMANIWHELDDQRAMVKEAARILKDKGRLAILDWREDLDTPPGPPREHRVPRQDLEQLLSSQGWQIPLSCHIGDYSYLVMAETPTGTVA